ncbi:DUF2625 family protein [Dactylosporangium vinaceum]|uniref:DUF2625 family protein n=1 Tax=Dactylosporangium vinaceum TaxID=53362 RepID=A0ABV5M9I9_9ACTN|nr:DUF2625 family protein [Dactylosporangium vinaceum]UAC00006.1 DUF2625 family protein [Dactylosporangium vinaceum]
MIRCALFGRVASRPTSITATDRDNLVWLPRTNGGMSVNQDLVGLTVATGSISYARHDDRVRSVEELTAAPESAWPALEAELLSNPEIVILPVAAEAGRNCLYRLQVSTRSRLGALALHTGGLLVEDGWLRVLGGGDAAGLPSLAQANGLPGGGRPPASLLVGHDVLGGRFEVNGADPAAIGRPGDAGEVCYFGSDSLTWEPCGAGHGTWLTWIAEGGTAEFYAALRWKGWQAETRALPLSHGLTVYPFLWSREAQQDLAATTRRPAPTAELFSLQDEFAARFADEPNTTALHIRVD